MPKPINQLKEKKLNHFKPCPLFTGKHKWSLLAFRSEQGLVYYCQLCYCEKLIPYVNNKYTNYYSPGTYYTR